MAGSKLDLANMALGHIRQREMLSLTERSPAAREVARFYDTALAAALRSFDWPFARAIATTPQVMVSANVALSAPGWCRAYEMPTGCLALREISRERRNSLRVPYEVMRYGGRSVIFTNAVAPTFRFTVAVDDVPDYSPDFVSAFTYTLAAELAMPLTGKVSLVDAMRKLAAQVVDRAETAASNEDLPDGMADDVTPDWLRVRGIPDMTMRERRGDLDPPCGATAATVIGPTPTTNVLSDNTGRPISDAFGTVIEV
jgi:hypothetical protein